MVCDLCELVRQRKVQFKFNLLTCNTCELFAFRFVLLAEKKKKRNKIHSKNCVKRERINCLITDR